MNHKVAVFVFSLLAYCGTIKANELPFGLTTEMTRSGAKSKLAEKKFLSFEEAWSKDGDLNYRASDFALNEVSVYDVDVAFYKDRLLEVSITTKNTDDINEAFSRLVKLRNFFTEQGKKVSSDQLHEIKKGGDLEQSNPVIVIEGKPCNIFIYTNLSKGKANQTISYRVMSVQIQKTADKKRERESSNKKAADMLR